MVTATGSRDDCVVDRTQLVYKLLMPAARTKLLTRNNDHSQSTAGAAGACDDAELALSEMEVHRQLGQPKAKPRTRIGRPHDGPEYDRRREWAAQQRQMQRQSGVSPLDG